MAGWNPWHGCHKLSEGCRHCYVYRMDERHGHDSSVVRKTGEFDLPLRHKRDGSHKIPPGEIVYTCFTSDFSLMMPMSGEKAGIDVIKRPIRFEYVPEEEQTVLDRWEE